MKKFISVVFIFFALLALAYYLMTPHNNKEAQELVDKVKEHFEKSDTPIKLSELTDFDWDEVCYFAGNDSEPGAADREYQNYLKNKSIEMGMEIPKEDYYALFVFLKDKKAFHYIGINSGKMYLDNENASAWIYLSGRTRKARKCIKPDEASYKIIKHSAKIGDKERKNISIIFYSK